MGDVKGLKSGSEAEKDTAVTTLSDTLLLERMSKGDTASFDAVFYTHYDRVYGLLFRLLGNRTEAEDLTQEVFLQLHHHAFRRRLFDLQREHNIGAWLYRTATNMGYNAIRGRQRRWQRNLVLVPDPAGSPGVDKEVERREQVTAVRRALARLPQRQTQLLLMRQMDFSYEECAQACGVAPGSVGTLLARASKAFKQLYEEEQGK
ncbi:MAG: sigma-70 family RNA polymerase sigma factor [Anaerolineae bacterium]|nr:sigma-70 family RNA polymerase sigma factor [Anaerolineae bacterium]